LGVILDGTDIKKSVDELVLVASIPVVENEFDYKIGDIIISRIE
jgi:hypothetical protein